MRFPLNMNLPRELGRRLAGAGHQCRHAGDVGLSRAGDREIVEVAREAGEAILTHDLDYGNLLAFSGAPGPSVVTFRLRKARAAALAAALIAAWEQVGEPIEGGAIVVIGDATVRVRRLPMAR